MMMIGLISSGSRSAWIALPAALVALVILGVRNGTAPGWVPVTGAAVFLAVAGFFYSLSPLMRERVAEGQLSPLMRERVAEGQMLVNNASLTDPGSVQMAHLSLTTARRHPFFGAGPGTFAFISPENSEPVAGWQSAVLYDDYLNCVDDYGLVGFGVAMFFVAAVTLKFFQPLWVDHRWQDRALVAAGFAAWVALLVQSAVDYNLHIPANALILFALTGLAMGRIKQERGVDLGVRTYLAPAPATRLGGAGGEPPLRCGGWRRPR